LQNFNRVLDTLIPLVPVYKKTDVEAYYACTIRLHEKICEKAEWKRATLVHMYQGNRTLALKFIVVLTEHGYFEERVQRSGKKTVIYLLATDKLYNLYAAAQPPTKEVVYPVDTMEYKSVRRGAKQDTNAFAMMSVATPYFTINSFVYDLLKKVPPPSKVRPVQLSHQRAMFYAREYEDKEFRFPWFRDSRGRAYVASTVGFSPQGSDTEKALVIPTKKEVVTPAGWETMHEAALGYAEVELTTSEIIRLATYPEETKDEWLQFDKPYCFIAMADLITQVYLNPDEPVAGYIPLDGRCSGLQHWSALSKTNAITARLGMEPNEAADGLDMYEFVASNWVKDLPELFKYLATRKSAKVSVMTFPYSATRTTSMDSIRDLFMAPHKWDTQTSKFVQTGEGLTYKECGTLGSSLYNCVTRVLQPIVEGRDWLTVCAGIIMKETGLSQIKWTTPDGFMASQDAYKNKKLDIKTKYKGKAHYASTNVPQLGFDGRKVPDLYAGKNKIAPNLIHALDATHLRMVAAELGFRGIDGIWIHDSFAVHVNYRAELYEIIIEEFIKLYSGNYLEELREDWQTRYEVTLPAPPVDGTWSVEILKDCPRFFE